MSEAPESEAPDLLILLHERADALPPVTVSPADRMRVPFTGSRGGEGPLTLCQDGALRWVTNTAYPTRMMEWPLPLPKGTTLADIAATLQILMSRHESLRTCYPRSADVPAGAIQRVARSGELVVEVYTADDEPADDAVLVTALSGPLRAREFDLTAELPLRVAVATWQGMPRAAVILYSHAAADYVSMALIDRQFAELISDPPARTIGPPGHQPLDQAAYEYSAQGRRKADRALRGWEAALRTMPQCLYAVPSASADSRYGGVVSGWLWSRAGALALPPIAARTGANRQLIVFAALCAMIAWRTGHDRCFVPVLATNRYERHLQNYVGTLVRDGAVSVDMRAEDFDEVVRRAGAAILRGHRYSMVDQVMLERIYAKVEHERGITYCRYCTFNDISAYQAESLASEPEGDADAARQALPGTRFAQLPAPGAEEQLVQLLLYQVDGEMIIGATTRDASRVPLGELETLLRGAEALLVEAASGNVPLSRLGEITGVQPIARGPGWVYIDSSWVDMAEAQRLVDDALPPPAAAFAIPAPGGRLGGASPRGPELVAYLTAGNGVSTPEQAHQACMSVLAGTRTLEPPEGIRYTAMAPGRYIICAEAPSNAHDLAAWREQPVVAEGDGRRD